MDIKCQTNGLSPDAVVLVATIRSLKYHGGMSKEEVSSESIEYFEKGLDNLFKHYDNLTNVYGFNVVVAINRFNTDTDNEIKYLCNVLEEKNIDYAVTTGYSNGSDGSLELASKVIELCDRENNFRCCYDLEDDIKTKIFKVSTKVYGAQDVEYSNEALEVVTKLEKDGYENLPICIAKSHYSLSDDPKNLLCNNDYNIHIKDVILKAGAEFIVVLTGTIMTMPGLPKKPNSGI